MISTVFLELTNHCNMNCNFCANHLMTRPRGYMPIELAKSVINQLKEMKFKGSLITSLMGEPLMHPNFKEILKYSIELGIKTNVITNFSLVPRRISPKELLTAGIDILCLSYQTPDKDSFESRGTKISFEKYFNKLRDILIFVRDNYVNTRRIEIHILQSLYNYLNVEVINDYSLIELAVLKLFDALYQNISCTSSVSHKKMISKSVKKFRRGKQYLDAFEIKIGSGLYVVLKRANTWANHLIPEGCTVLPQNRGHCGFFHSTLGILWNGRCTVCCQDFDGHIFVGDAQVDRIESILKSERLSSMREMEKKGLMVNEYCQVCKGKIRKNGHDFSIIKKHGVINKFFQLIDRSKVKLFK